MADANMAAQGQGGPAQAPGAPPKEMVNPFASISIKKRDGFPNLARKIGDRTIIVGPADGPAWVSSASSWFASRGAPGIFDFFEHVSPLLPDDSGPAPLDPENPDVDIIKNIPGMKKVLKRFSETELGNHLGYPGPQRLTPCLRSKQRKDSAA